MSVETTPNGTRIEYHEKPRRHYLVNGCEVPSVTTVLGCLDKPGLPWWGMKLGAEGVIHLLDNLPGRLVPRIERLGAIYDDPVGALTAAKMTVNHVRDRAGDRGTAIHDALEALVADDAEISPASFPDEEQGYVNALLAWYRDAQPEVQDVEVMVGVPPSPEAADIDDEPLLEGFAGRYDLRASIPTCELVVRADTGQRETFEAGSYRWDAKTPKGVYATHLLQLDGYETGAVACGYPSTDAQAVIRLGKDGTYEVVRNTAPPGSFLAIVNAYQALKAAEPQRPRKKRAA